MTVEVRPMTEEDERFYRALCAEGELPAFIAECDGVSGYGNTLEEAHEHCRQGLAHRAALCGVEPTA